MSSLERSLLLESHNVKLKRFVPPDNALSAILASVCIVDVFGVFPVVTLPKAILLCGYYGIPVVAVTISAQLYTATLLGKCWLMAEELEPAIRRKNRYPYAALAEITFGKWVARFVTFLLDASIFAGGVPNLIVAAQNLQLLGQRVSGGSFDFSYCCWMVLIGAVLCPFLWLGSPKDMKLLCVLSVSLVIGVFVLVVGCILFDTALLEPSAQPVDDTTPLWNYVLTAYGILIFQFDIHPTVLTIQVDMSKKRDLNKAIFTGFFVTLSMSTIITAMAAVKYGSSTRWSLLDTLPPSSSLHTAAFLAALQLSLTSAIGNTALYQHVEDCLGVAREFNRRRCLIRSVLTVLAVVVAESVPRFDLVMAMIGGTLVGPLVFVLPPLYHIKMLGVMEGHGRLSYAEIVNLDPAVANEEFDDSQRIGVVGSKRRQIVVCVLIAAFGVLGIGLSTYVNVVNTVRYATFSKPCIYNLTVYL